MGPVRHDGHDAAAWGHARSGRRLIGPQSTQRHLSWQGCYNVRDLGGLVKADGRLTPFGSVIRADMLGRLTIQGRQQLLDYGVRSVIDLRRPEELQGQPAIDLGPDCKTRTIHLEQNTELKLSGMESRAAVYKLIIDHNRQAIAQIMRAVLQAGQGGLVIHCHAGKDRTGVIAAMLLDLAGVGRQQILDDYAQSQACLWPLYEKMVAEAGGEDKVHPWMKPIADPQTMRSFLDHIDRTYAGIEPYLKSAGLSQSEIEQLKAKL